MAKKAGAKGVFICGNTERDDVKSITSISGLKAIL